MSEEKKHTPITTLTYDFLRTLPITEEAKDGVDAAEASIIDEFDVFVRANNRTDFRRDGLAAASAKMEKLIDGRDGYALTYSTMKDRRVDDILFCLLDHASTFVFPPKEREDKKKDGSPKMESRAAERTRWITSLGYTKAEVGKGKRNIFGDAFAELKAELEEMIPERFDGTKPPETAKQLLALISPANLGAEIIRINVYKPHHEGNTNSLITLMRFLLAGFRFQTKTDASGKVEVVGELAQFYADLAGKEFDKLKEKEHQELQQQMEQDAKQAAA